MKHDILTRSHLVLSGIRQQQKATRARLRNHLRLGETELRRALLLLKQYHLVEYQGRGDHRCYTLTAQGEAWWHEHRPYAPLTAEQVSLREKRRSLALQLEAKALWHRAARQWLLVLDLCEDDASRVKTLAHRERCMQLATTKSRVPSGV
ncbi:PerC family transcriptional regulator [Serratia fonticola]